MDPRKPPRHQSGPDLCPRLGQRLHINAYDGTIYLEFTPEDLEKFECRWETPDGHSLDSRWQCYFYPLTEYMERHGGRIPTPEEYFD